jgi:hypothetical protein
LRWPTVGAQMPRQDRETKSDVAVMSPWEDIDSMSIFVGGGSRRIRHLACDAAFFVERAAG